MTDSYRGNTRAIDDLDNLARAFMQDRGQGGALLESILNDRDRCGELILMTVAYIQSIWEQVPEAGIMWASARQMMKKGMNN